VKKYVYVAYSKDKYKLPIFIADSPKELSAVVGVDSNTISSMICRAKTKGKECRFAKVDISEV
jgi:ribosomal protein L7Ae-like RNA K-turn-binding protein